MHGGIVILGAGGLKELGAGAWLFYGLKFSATGTKVLLRAVDFWAARLFL